MKFMIKNNHIEQIWGKKEMWREKNVFKWEINRENIQNKYELNSELSMHLWK